MNPRHLARTLSPHEHKLFTEIFCRVKIGIHALELLHIELEDDFHTLYELTGDPIFQRAYENLHSVPHPLVHHGLPQ
jgi:hypothetical protein